MPETTKGARLAKVAREINLGIETIAEHLRKKGFEVDAKPTTKLTAEMYNLLKKDFNSEIVLKQRAEQARARPSFFTFFIITFTPLTTFVLIVRWVYRPLFLFKRTFLWGFALAIIGKTSRRSPP